jgi:hypothetical protein
LRPIVTGLDGGTMKILFVMDRRVNAGSIQAVAAYARAGDELGHTIALYGHPDPGFPTVRFSTAIADADYVVFILESGLRWLSGLRLPRILCAVPPSRRAILDADGLYNVLVKVNGYDRNHAGERARMEWLAHCDLLAGRVFQPSPAPGLPGVRPLPFYGFDPGLRIKPGAAPAKRFDLMHVGHNWWRWQDMSQSLLPSLERIRGQVGDVSFVGSWWNGTPPTPIDGGLEQAFRADREAFERLQIEVKPPVHFTEVIPTMSESRVNIMTQRPLFRQLRILTSKYFELFAADTIPLVMLDPDHAEAVYGPAGRHLSLHGDGVAERLLDALRHPRRYEEIVDAVRGHLEKHHSYRQRVAELVAALTCEHAAP